ncbi:MAG TPA: deoxyribodipyrimidine photo-lyase [Candidatus Didemnitutus sp.]|jgi:deoxyribodipyrimidine photo-lyase
MKTTLVWFRQDLRLKDNPALSVAVRSADAVVPVYVWDQKREGRWPLGSASKWWLHHSLVRLAESLRRRGSRLVVAAGDSTDTLIRLARATRATSIYWNRRYEPSVVSSDRDTEAALAANGIAVRTFGASLLFEPEDVRNKSGGPFQVFTPFWRHCLSLRVAVPERLPSGPFAAPKRWPGSVGIKGLSLLPAVDWANGFDPVWNPGEKGAARALRRFLADGIDSYATDRDRLDRADRLNRDRPCHGGTSALSPHLHFGEIGPRQIWAAVKALSRDSGVFPSGRGAQVFLKELGWREFAYHLLWHFPRTPTEPLRERFAAFPWQRDIAARRAWQRGRTGYPIVDAGMRQLWAAGWMHNRARMIVASFLVKHLRHSWREGAAWFWETLVDADLANNTLGWQWSAGCGADAAPYFRIFNPVRQGRKFDPGGTYVRRWVPELARLPAEYIHEPWSAPKESLAEAGVALGSDYPLPMVDHAASRQAALAAFKSTVRSRPG